MRSLIQVLSVILFSILTSCSAKIEKLTVKTDKEKIFVHVEIDNHRDELSSGVEPEDVDFIKEKCKQYGLDHKINFSFFKNKLYGEVEINGFDKANAFISDIRSKIPIRATFLRNGDEGSVLLNFEPGNFIDNGKILIETSSKITNHLPVNFTHNLRYETVDDYNLSYRIHVDTNRSLNTAQEISYNYQIKNDSIVDADFWSPKEIWLFVFALVGAVGSIYTVRAFYKSK